MNEVIDLLRRHRSIRRFAGEPVDEAHVRAAVAAGQSASTSSACQAYSVIRVRSADARARLVALTGNQPMVADAGAFFLICGDARRHRLAATRAGGPYDARLEAFLLAVVDASLFAQNLAVAFESLGYGICYVGGLRNHPFEVDRLLALPQGVYPLYGLCVGRPAEDPLPKPRLPVDAVLFDDRYPEDDAMLAALDEHDRSVGAYCARRNKKPVSWAALMAEKFAAPSRTELAAYYASKGADLR